MSNSNRDDRWLFGVSTRAIRSKGAVLLALVVALLIALPSSALAATVLMVGGLGQSTLDDATMKLALGGKFAGSGWTRINVRWPADAAPLWGTANLADSVAAGTTSLVAAIRTADSTTSGPITILGTSAGSLVVDEAMRVLANDPTWHPRNAIDYVVLADSTQKLAGTPVPVWNPFDTLSGYTYKAPPVTPFKLTVVTYEYDGFADFPDRWWNSWAVYNAIAGGIILHAQTWFLGPDLSKVDAHVTVTNNKLTTTYLVHPDVLPLVQLYPSLAPIQDWLKEQIDAGYSRNDQPAVSSTLSLRETAPLETTPDPQSFNAKMDPSADASAKLVEVTDQEAKGAIDSPPAPDDTTPAAVETVKVADAVTSKEDSQTEKAGREVGNNGATRVPSHRNVSANSNGGTNGIHGNESTPAGPKRPDVTGADRRGGVSVKESRNEAGNDGADGGGTTGGSKGSAGTEGPGSK